MHAAASMASSSGPSCSRTGSESSDSDSEDLIEPESILERLRSPTPSDLTRKRKIRTNPPPKGVKRSKAQVASEPLSVSISARLKEFPNECLCNSGGKLFCNACREPLSRKKSSITLHIKSTKHANGKSRLEGKQAKERLIVDMLTQYDKSVHPV